MEDKRPLIIVAGPTAVGKTRLSIALAKAVGGEIISADSMQVYKKMNIGSAKVLPDEMQGVRHHLIDICEPTEEYNVVLFARKASVCMEQIYQQGKLPILTGGTGFYIQAVLYGIDFTQNPEVSSIRSRWEKEAALKGKQYVHTRLSEVDPCSAEAIHPNNVKRVIRALEFYEQTGERISEHNEAEKQKSAPYDYRYFVLTDIRENLYRNIDRRVDLMLEKGLVEEVASLKEKGCKRDSTAMQGLGYKEILDYLEGRLSLEEAVYVLKRDTRHFAKRQLTWFRREKNVIWVPKEKFEYDDTKILEYMLDKI